MTTLCLAAFIVGKASYAQTQPAKATSKASAERRSEPNPFEKHVRVADGIYVYDRSQFARYTGPLVSARNPDAEDGVVERKGLGAILVSPGIKFNIELVAKPMHESYEFKDIKTGSVVHEFTYFATSAASLLFTGQGVVYEHARLDPLCWGTVTRKYEFTDGKFTETRQPFLLLAAETEVLQDSRLFVLPTTTSAQVALLKKGMKVTVLAYEGSDRFLVKTPLGLTGWLINDSANSSVSITQCN
ncbi:MAG: SH3 domain-containing protein [Rhodocyclales bacterium]|nr:SH3 domain-containing protein [Rhodocyclales bacterium]